MAIQDRYPDSDILGERGHWDDATRRVVLDRVHNVPKPNYFDAALRATLEAVCARVIPQSHRPPDRRVPIAPWIEARCQRRTGDGTRYDDMPPGEVAWEWGLEGVDQTAWLHRSESFVDLEGGEQDEVLRLIRDGSPPGAVWDRLPASRWWYKVAVREIAGTYYAHPYAWDEIGFGGPAYPRGYASLNFGAPEPWEAREVGEVIGSRQVRRSDAGRNGPEAGR